MRYSETQPSKLDIYASQCSVGAGNVQIVLRVYERNSVKLTKIALYQLPSNDQAERSVQPFIYFFKMEGSNSMKQSLSRFSFSCRTTQNSRTGQTPAELFPNRRLKRRLDLVRPNLRWKAMDKQSDQKYNIDKEAKNGSSQLKNKSYLKLPRRGKMA